MEPFLLSCIDSKIENNRSFYGRFQLGPFDTGQGITIANALRRTLLSELTGLAITLVEIQGVSHEYSSILGVRESVLDILQNLKQLVFKSDFQVHEPQIGYLIISGPAVVRAGDLKLPLPIQCVDPEQYIATLSYNGYLNIKFIINKGKNYIIQTPVDNDYLKQCSILKNFHFPKPTQLNRPNFSRTISPINRASLDSPEPIDWAKLNPPDRKSIPPIDRSEIQPNFIQPIQSPPSPLPINEGANKNKGLEPLGVSEAQTVDSLANNGSGNIFEKIPPDFNTKTNVLKESQGQQEKNKFIGSSEFAINKYLLSKEWFVKKQNQAIRAKRDSPNERSEFPTNRIVNTPRPFSSFEVPTMSQETLKEPIGRRLIGGIEPTESPPNKKTDQRSNSPTVRSDFPSSSIRPISGFFPIDALFMPINKVNYIIELDENYENSKERVILEIWTNGSLHPRQAIHEAIKRLIELFRPFQKTSFTQYFSSFSGKIKKNTLNNVKFKILLQNNMSSVQFSGPPLRSRNGLNDTNERSQWVGGYSPQQSLSQLDDTQSGGLGEAQSFQSLQKISEADCSPNNHPNSPQPTNLNWGDQAMLDRKKSSKIYHGNEHEENTKINNYRNVQYQKLHYLFKRKLATLDIGNFDFSLKLYIQLKNQNINTISELLKYSSEDLLKFKKIQKQNLDELNNVLSQVGLSLRDSSNSAN